MSYVTLRGRGQEMVDMFGTFSYSDPWGGLTFFPKSFFFLSEHRDMVKVNEWENPQIKGILLIFEVAFFQQ